MSVLFFTLHLGLLALEGWFLARLLQPSLAQRSALRGALALPLGAVVNYLLTLLYTVLHIPLAPFSLWTGHVVLCVAVSIAARRRQAQPLPPLQNEQSVRLPLALRAICMLLLCVTVGFGLVHTVLPTYPIDNFTNWTMRSQVSFHDHAIAFDTNEIRGVAKPQYPFLLHALQITTQQGNALWSDTSAHGVLFLLLISSFAAIFLLMRLQVGAPLALLFTTLLGSFPLLSYHLIPGYGDLPMALFLGMALLCLALAARDASWLALAATCVLAAAWIKSEGVVTGVVPFLFALFFLWSHRHVATRSALWTAAVTVLLTLPQPLLVLARGLSLTPHGSDMSIACSSDALGAMPAALFASGSLSASFTALLLLVLLLLTRMIPTRRGSLWLFSWGGFALAMLLFTYVCTPNAVFFLSQEAFFRQMFTPFVLLLLTCALCFEASTLRRAEREEYR